VAYPYEFDFSNPDGSSQNPVEMGDSTLSNLLSMLGAIISGGITPPGWSWQAQDLDGTYPPSDGTQPDQYAIQNGSRIYWVICGWDATYVGRLDTIQIYYSGDGGSSYDVVKGGTTNGLLTFTYDSDGAAIAGDWS
jgi:hypothetical protein